MAEAQEKLEGEEHAAGKLGDKIKKAEKAFDDLQNKADEQKENITRVSHRMNFVLCTLRFQLIS